MKIRLMALAISISYLTLPNQLLADVDILIIGSTHVFSEGNESGVVQQKAFNLSTIATHLHSIIDQNRLITETVNNSGSAVYNFTSCCYNLAQHYMWPEVKTERIANFPGMVAEGVKLIQAEVAQGANPAQIVLFGQC